jgi:hypothetical protein
MSISNAADIQSSGFRKRLTGEMVNQNIENKESTFLMYEELFQNKLSKKFILIAKKNNLGPS